MTNQATLFGTPDHKCERARWVRFEMVSGQFHYAFWCPDCGNITQQRYGTRGIWAKKREVLHLSGLDPDTLPVQRAEYDLIACARCATKGAENHHIAPVKMFEDADAWPQVALCPKCHRVWHEIVTPSLIRPYNPVKHAETLGNHLSLAQLDALAKALVDHVALEVM